MAAPSDDDDGDEFLFSFFLFEGGAFLPFEPWLLFRPPRLRRRPRPAGWLMQFGK